jgi:plasmid stabilization system protein ParE
MSFTVRELPKAKSDVRAIFEWLYERSTQGAKAWIDAYDAALLRLKTDAGSLGFALDNNECPEFELRQIFFKTRRGRIYRAVYFIAENTVYVLRVRGPGQAPIDPDDLE